MQNRKSADVVIIAGWNVGTATRCAGFIGNFRAKHSSVAAAGWNTFQTTKFAPAAIGAIKSPRHQPGKILNWCLVFLVSRSVGASSRSSAFACAAFLVVKPRTSGSSSLPDHDNGQSLTVSAGPVEFVNDRKDVHACSVGLELPVPVDPAGRLARQQRICRQTLHFYHFAILHPDTDFDPTLYPHAFAVRRIGWRRISNGNGFGRKPDNN